MTQSKRRTHDYRTQNIRHRISEPGTPGPRIQGPAIQKSRSWDPRTHQPGTQDPRRQDLGSLDLWTRTWDPGPRATGSEILDLSVCKIFNVYNFIFWNFQNCLMSRKSPRIFHAICIQFSLLFLRNVSFHWTSKYNIEK